MRDVFSKLRSPRTRGDTKKTSEKFMTSKDVTPLNYMRKSDKVWIMCLISLSLALFVAVGCTAKINIRTEGSLTGYKKVYMFVPKAVNDPLGVHPKVVEGLKSIGFNVRELKEDETLESQGSGFIITPEGHILTCAHVVSCEKEATIWIKGERYEADVLVTDKEKDLSIIKVKSPPEKGFKPIILGKNYQYSMGQEVYTMGFPLTEILGNEPRLNKGLISATVGLNDNPNNIQISAEIQPGNSGSPVLDSDKKVIGIVSSTINPLKVLVRTMGNLPQNVNFALKLSSVEEFIRKSGVQYIFSENPVSPPSFETIKESVAQVHSGIVPAEKSPELICHFNYRYYRDRDNEPRSFYIRFYDIKLEKDIFTASCEYAISYRFYEKEFVQILKEITTHFFPERKP
jgi:S1-C subfamily serine protease